VRIAINGFGRIGKNFLRVFLKQQPSTPFEIVAINVGPADPEVLAYSIKYDSVLGRYEGDVHYEKGVLSINGMSIQVFAERNANKLPWRSLGIDWVVDVSGKYTDRAKAEEHLRAGAGSVLISAPAHGDDVTIIPGVNSADYDPQRHKVVSLGSCTTNAVIPLLATLIQSHTVTAVSMTTAHAYTNSQALLDSMGSTDDLRRGRAAALNIVPSTTGALDLAARLLPELKGKVLGCSLRVPVANVSIIDLIVVLEKTVSTEELYKLFDRAAQAMPGILAVTREQLVSSDFQGSSASVVVDASMTHACGNMVKVMGWYDNEYGYSCRLFDFLARCAQ